MPSTGPPRSRTRLRALALLISAASLLSLEAGLRLSGFGQSHPLFVQVPEAPAYLRANPNVVRRFIPAQAPAPKLWIRPVHFRREKAPGTFRIFVQGESTAEGYPYGFVASLAGMLQQRLQRTFPERRIEVITTAMSAVSSYTLLDFADEIIANDPDAVLIYAGHNEYVGILGVGSAYSFGVSRPAVLFSLWLRELRIFQLVQRLFSVRESEEVDQSSRTLMARIVREKKIPYDSPLYRRGLEQYRANMGALLARYEQAGVPVFIATVVSNERDQPPFTSAHRAGADVAAWQRHFDAGRRAAESGDATGALVEFEAAVGTDDLRADGHYALAQALDRLGRYPEARRAYLAAKDRDELRFRAPEAINDILRELAADRGAHVVEVQQAFVRAAKDGIVGADLMLEHLHPNLRGYFLMADAFHDAMRENGMVGRWDTPIPREQAWAEIPVSEVDRLYGEYRIRYLTSDWPFSNRKVPFRVARATGPVEEIAQAYYRGRYEWPDAMKHLLDHYRSVGDDREAAKVAVLLAEAFPHEQERQALAAEFLLKARRPEVEVYLERALELVGPHDRGRILALRADPRYAAIRPGR